MHSWIITKNLILNNEEIAKYWSKFGVTFDNTWQNGMKAYLEGNWRVAWINFEKTMSMIMGLTDGPSENLLKFIES